MYHWVQLLRWVRLLVLSAAVVGAIISKPAGRGPAAERKMMTWAWGAVLAAAGIPTVIDLILSPLLFLGCTFVAGVVLVMAVHRQMTCPFAWENKFSSAEIVDDSKISRNGFTEKKLSAITRNGVDAVVIGSGIGGLTTAALLSMRGKRVVVFEQHDVAGGCTHTFLDRGFEFDTGVHYVGKLSRGSELLLAAVCSGCERGQSLFICYLPKSKVLYL